MLMKSVNTHIRKRLSKNIDGDILGMPLYLFIVIVVTVIGLGILLAWLALIDDPPTTLEATVTPITIYIFDDGAHGDGAAGDDIYANNALDITVIVNDNNGNKVNGASVSLDGMGIEDGAGGRVIGTTTDGKIVFNGLQIIDQQKTDGKITVTVEKGEQSDTAIITVKWN